MKQKTLPGLLLLLLLVIAVLSEACNPWSADAPALVHAVVGHNPDSLWEIVDTCINHGDVPYAACPAFRKSTCDDTDLADDALVWALTPNYVAIRDMRECGCPPSFVGGLVLPRVPVRSSADKARKEGVWPFAWKVAAGRISNSREIALTVNPATLISQAQLHVHIARLESGFWEKLHDSGPKKSGSHTHIVHMADLNHVFSKAASVVGEQHMMHTGILVAQDFSGDGYIMLLTKNKSPEAYTVYDCMK